MQQCHCAADGFCKTYQKQMTGRLREICRGENISVENQQAYKDNWLRAKATVCNKFVLSCHLSPGDLLALSAAIYSLHLTYPGKYLTDVSTSCNEIFDNNSFVSPVDITGDDVAVIDMHYPAIDRSNQHSTQFIKAYTEFLSERIGKPIQNLTNRPMVYFSASEIKYAPFELSKPYWIINAGIKQDFTCKQWPIEYYQQVVDDTRGDIQWIQIGETHQVHHELKGAINLIGKTTFRQLMHLALHSSGGLGPVTALMHLLAAVEKPYICINGGRESVPWIQYQLQHTLHSIGLLDCCRTGGCWRSRVIPLQTGYDDTLLNGSLCDYPIQGLIEPVAKCMAMIKPVEVTNILRRYNNATSVYSSGL